MTARDDPSESVGVLYGVGLPPDCDHGEVSYVGNMGTTAMYRCEVCGGVVVRNCPDPDGA